MVLAELQIQDKGRVDLVKQLDEFIIVVGDISAGPINDHGAVLAIGNRGPLGQIFVVGIAVFHEIQDHGAENLAVFLANGSFRTRTLSSFIKI